MKRKISIKKQPFTAGRYLTALRSRWVDGRAALMGDAAHPMLPFIAQGAAMAVEDAWVIAKVLLEPDTDVSAALQAYQNTRLKRTRYIQGRAQGNAKTFHQHSFLGQLTTYGPMCLLC